MTEHHIKEKLTTTHLKNSVLLLLIIILLMGCGKDNEPAVTRAEINKPAPDFTLVDLQGKIWQLSSLRGKVVFINFWATWCPPCLEEMPSMQALNTAMANAPFQMLTILNNDQPAFAQNLVNKLSLTFPVLIDPNSETGTQYGLTGVPETFIIDPEGILREKFLGPRPWNSQGAMDMLNAYFPHN
ncbi:MAG: TlpA family protein disulfide reductase [Desulfobulbaceae bacterium]|uniref:TlpA family protein disulfide reductase n=1 Tax=Candidatus Desulfobia pelagia TaxID=2841692 RepID=A0A8J6TC22_9BACT|nr:TlpA family protein disulfide reductase [Candidatus Desulfobia pelagia]